MSDTTGIAACRNWIDEIDWDMIHEDAVTRFLEWGNNDPKSALRPPVTSSGEYSVYFVVDTWNLAEPKVVLMRMDNYGSQSLCEKNLPPELAASYLTYCGRIRGIHELNDEVKDWVKGLLEGGKS